MFVMAEAPRRPEEDVGADKENEKTEEPSKGPGRCTTQHYIVLFQAG